MHKRRVVVTGLGCITPLGNSIESYWSGLLEGKSGASEITHLMHQTCPLNSLVQSKILIPTNILIQKR